MKKMKGKRLLSLLLTLCMVLSLVPVTAMADYAIIPGNADVGDTYTTKGKTAPEAPEGTFWECTTEEGYLQRDLEKCTNVEHSHSDDCYSKNCSHKDGHISICYENTVYSHCTHENDNEHTEAVDVTVVVKREGWSFSWNTEHPAYNVVLDYYNSLAGWDKLSILSAKFCYTVSESTTPDNCNHRECSAVGGSCYTTDILKGCLGYEHTHTIDCKSLYYDWVLRVDVNRNGIDDDDDTYHTVTYYKDNSTVHDTESVLTGMYATGNVVDPEKEYYNFVGWDFNFATKITVDTPVYAEWELKNDNNSNNVADETEKYTVVYQDEDGSVIKTFEDLAYGADTPTCSEPTKDNHNFAGWTPAVVEQISAPASGNEIVYKATWTEQDNFKVTFVNGDDRDEKFVYVGETLTEPAAPRKDNYIFKGWYEENATEEFVFGGSVSKALTLYAKWAEDFNNNGVEDAKETIKVNVVGKGDVTATVSAGELLTVRDENIVSFIYDATRVDTVAIKATPGEKCYVEDIEVGAECVCDDASFNGTVATYNAPVSVKEVTVTFAERTVTVADNRVVQFVKSDTVSVASQKDAIEAQIKAYVDAAGYDAATAEVSVYGEFILVEGYVEYKDFLPLGFGISEYTWGNLVFGDADTEQVKVKLPAVGKYPAVETTFEITVTEKDLISTEIRLKDNANVEVTYNDFTDAEVMNELLDGVYADRNRDGIFADDEELQDAEVTFAKNPTKMNAGDEVEVTLVYAGDNETYKGAKATANITINKAPVSVTVNSKIVKYEGTAYKAEDLVTTNPGNVDTINLIVGIDVAELQLDKENGVTGAEAVVMMQLPDLKADDLIPDEYEDAFGSILDNIFGAGASDKLDNISTSKYEGELSLAEVAKLLQGMGLGNDVVTEDVADQVMQNLKNIQTELGVEDIKVVVNGKPKNIGAYLVVGVTADQNYETAMNVGYLAITPDGYKATLDWKVQDENGAVALEAIENGNYDLGAYVTKVAEGKVEDAEKELELVFFGVDKDGNIVLTQDQADLTLGAYTELAFIMNWGNTMYYAEPIARTFVVVPKLVDVKFVDANGNENNDRVFVYDGEAHGMDVAVDGVVTNPDECDELTVTYTGVTVEGTVYNDTDAPVLPGAYAVTATYVEKDADGAITGMGFAVGAMVIDMDAELVTVKFIDENGNENNDRVFEYDGEAHGMKAVATDAEGNVLSDEYMTVTYVGIKGDGKGYNSTEKPVDAGVYTVTAVYEQRGEDGYIDKAGMAVGAMVIKKAVADGIVINNAEVEYDGNEHFEEIFAEGSVQPEGYIAVVYDEEKDTVNVLYPEELDVIVDELRARVKGVEIPEELDAETLAKVDAAVAEILDNIVVPEDFADELEDALEDIEKLLAAYDDLKDITVTFNGEKPVEVGKYDIYVLTYDPNYESVYGNATLTITKHEHTYSTVWSKDDVYHWHAATCGHDVVADKDEHAYVNGVCECGAEEPVVPHEHTYSTEWSYNGTYHWKEATCDHDLVRYKAAHDFGSDRTCDTCGYTYSSGGSSGGGGGSTKYAITVEDTTNGTLELSHKKASSGTTVTITTLPEAGYEASDITVTTSKNKTVEVKDLGNGKYTFKMPADKVVVDGNFVLSGEGTAAEQKVIILTIDSVIAWVFDEYVVNDVAPVIRNERTMLPARFVAEALGGVVTWNADEQKVTIVNGERTIEIFIDKSFALVNNVPVELDSPAFIENSRTYLPIRFIAENMGATVTWDAVAQKVTIIPGK